MIAAGLGILAFAIFSIGHGRRFLTRAEFIEAHFHRINGLQAGAPVSLSGVRIGAVDSIKFPEDPRATYVVVRMWIQESAADRVHTDSLAQISSIGLLGDKFVELTQGHPGSPVVEPGAVLPSRDPIDYEALLQRKGTDALIANVIAISDSMRSLLDQIEKGHGLLSELVHGAQDQQNQLNLASIQKTFESVNRLSSDMEEMIAHMNRGKGIAGALLSDETNGKRFLDNLDRTVHSLQETSQRVDKLVARFEGGQGLIPQLMENKQYADELLPELKQSSADLKDILHKINGSQGTIGLMVNDPTLYVELKSMLGVGRFTRAVQPDAPVREPNTRDPADGARDLDAGRLESATLGARAQRVCARRNDSESSTRSGGAAVIGTRPRRLGRGWLPSPVSCG